MLHTIQGWFLSGVGSVIVFLVGWVTKEYLIPYLTTERKRKMAKYILLIADEVTDYFLLKYQGHKWTEWIDQAVDKIIEITGVDKEIALRAAEAALSRKTTKR